MCGRFGFLKSVYNFYKLFLIVRRPELLFLLLCTLIPYYGLHSQNEDCNKLGAWLWHIETTGFTSHSDLADTLSALGIKRIYVKVADGRPNIQDWPEQVDEQLVEDYRTRGLEVWAWSYNYPGNSTMQAEALYLAAQTGYDGFVVDVEMQFDDDPISLQQLFFAFYLSREKAKADGFASDSFSLYCTTWGNPADHSFRIDVIDPYVDAYMPQTYVENWGPSYIDNLAFWIDAGKLEYESLGATKPIHHIVSAEQGIITAAEIIEFISVSGPETSIWRIPGEGVSLSLWESWKDVDWRYDFCTPTSVVDASDHPLHIFPNPASTFVNIKLENRGGQTNRIIITDIFGRVLRAKTIRGKSRISLEGLSAGMYFVQFHDRVNDRARMILKIVP